MQCGEIHLQPKVIDGKPAPLGDLVEIGDNIKMPRKSVMKQDV